MQATTTTLKNIQNNWKTIQNKTDYKFSQKKITLYDKSITALTITKHHSIQHHTTQTIRQQDEIAKNPV